jgi:hypothetical protein
MGIVANLDQSKATFASPAPGDIGVTDDSSAFGFDMYSFDIQFGIKFDPDPNIGLGGSPPSEQSWQIGIIQNVLQERLFFEYQELTANPSTKTFTRVFQFENDIVEHAKSSPFYDDQKTQLGGSAVRRPSGDIIYSSKGYRDRSAK